MKKKQNIKKIKTTAALFLALVLVFVTAGCDQKYGEKPVPSGASERTKTIDQTVASNPAITSDPAVVTEPAETNPPVDTDSPSNTSAPAVNDLFLFPSFETKDLDGNAVTSDLFAENAVTVVNLWFTGCIYCVNEMPTLEQIYQSYAHKPVQFISICVDIGLVEGADALARNIIEGTGVTFPTLWPGDGSTEFGQYLYSFFAFPTTVFVNRQGEIVGQPIGGAIMGEPGAQLLKSRIEEILSADSP